MIKAEVEEKGFSELTHFCLADNQANLAPNRLVFAP